jgi:hypothetical protein
MYNTSVNPPSLPLSVCSMYSVVVLLLTATLQAAAPFQPVACEGAYPKHLQGVCTNGKDTIYWSWTDAIVKTGLDGRIQKKVPTPSHQGDLCHHDSKVYVAVNLGKFNEPAGQADSWVFVFHGNTLEELCCAGAGPRCRWHGRKQSHPRSGQYRPPPPRPTSS